MLKKIIFFSTSYFGVPILRSLYQNGYDISVVYTQPPKKSNRLKIEKSPIQSLSETLNIECRTPDFLNDNEYEKKFLKELNADIALVVAYGQILSSEILSLTKKGFINIHASLLPQYRGAAPIQRSIMNLEKQTGISIMKVVEKLDAGPICNSYKLDLLKNENAESLSNRLSSLAAEKIADSIDDILSDKAVFKFQENSKATYADKILKSEGRIDWNDTSENIIGKINGLYRNPGAWFMYKGIRYKILRAETSNNNGMPGNVLSDNLEIACLERSIKIIEIQREGKRPQKINEFMLGSQIKKGSSLKDA